MRRIQRTTSSSSSNNNQRELQNNLPVIVIDDSTDEDTSILQQTTPPRRNNTAHPVVHNDTLPIAVSDDETTLNPFSPSSPLPFNSLDWSDADESSEYESSSDEDEAPNHNNIDNILERLTREEERATVSPRQTPPTVVQYPSMSNNNNNRNNNRNNNYYQPNRMINNHTNSSNNNNHSLPFLMNNNSNNSNNNNNNNSNRNLLHQHRMQSTSATAARIPIQASRRFVTPTASTNNRTPFTYPAHHHFHGGIPNNAQPMAFTSPTLERMVEQHILAQVIARSHHHHDVGGAIHPLMFVNRDFDDRDYEMLLALDDNVETTSKKTAASVVGKLPIVHIEEKECTCSICLEDLEVGSFASEIPFCNHKFHTECIEKWLKDYGHTCPVCKQEVTEIDFNHAKIIKEEVNNKRKGFSNKNVSESKFKKKKVE